MAKPRKSPALRCWCGASFTGVLAGVKLAAHQKLTHPGDPKNG